MHQGRDAARDDLQGLAQPRPLVQGRRAPTATPEWHPNALAQANKQRHLRDIAEATGVALEEMVFLDNERGNCLDVAELGVTVAWVPDGVTAKSWERTLAAYPAPGEIIDNRKMS